MVTYEADVAVVGAGTAGAAVAAFAAERGLSVVCVERRALDDAGARWVNGVAGWMFDEARLARPEGDELVGAGGAFHLVAGYGPSPRVVVRDHGLLDVDMRLLVARLQRMALARGATLLGDVRVTSFDGAVLETTAGRVIARTYVDASGLAGARLLEQPRVDRRAVCAAAQEVRRVKDVAAARAFFEANGAVPGDTVCFTGVAGGYSIVNACLHGDRIGVLTGSIPADGHPSGKALLESFVAKQRWIGETIFGGARAIPVQRPADVLARGAVALVGDAGGQVYAAHGSGIGAGIIAARMLTDALAEGRTPEHYAAAWQRRFRRIFASQDLFRRFSQALEARDIGSLMEVGLVDETAVRAGLLGELYLPPSAQVRAAFRRALGQRSLLTSLGGLAVRLPLTALGRHRRASLSEVART